MPELPFETDVQSLKQLRDSAGDFLLLDVRTPEEAEIASIDGAMLLPMQQILARAEELAPHRDRHIVVHCHHGGRSERVTMWLRQQGFAQAQNLAGGIDAWSAEIDPTLPRY